MGVWGAAGLVPRNSFFVLRPRLAKVRKALAETSRLGPELEPLSRCMGGAAEGLRDRGNCRSLSSRPPTLVAVTAPGPEHAVSWPSPAELSLRSLTSSRTLRRGRSCPGGARRGPEPNFSKFALNLGLQFFLDSSVCVCVGVGAPQCCDLSDEGVRIGGQEEA